MMRIRFARSVLVAACLVGLAACETTKNAEVASSSVLAKFELHMTVANPILQLNKGEAVPLAIAGTGYGLIGLLVIILLVILIVYFLRRA